MNSTYADISKKFSSVSFDRNSLKWSEPLRVSFFLTWVEGVLKPYVEIGLRNKAMVFWTKPWSIAGLAERIQTELKLSPNEGLKFRYHRNFPEQGFSLDWPICDKNLTLKELVEPLAARVEAILSKAEDYLSKTLDTSVLATYFQFPEKIKTACKQYLIYFAQFLADLGIEAEADVQEKAGKTLFTITPKNKQVGLEKINEALETYLNAPGDQSFEIQVITQSDFAVGQWQANVYHLKSQLAFSKSMLQMKEATIEVLQLSNFRYKEMLELQSLKPSESEDVVKGIVSVKKYEGKGFSVNLPEILRRLKRKF